MWGSMLNELTNHSQPQRIFSLRSRLYPIGHDPLPCCAASADASQLDILLCQCRILRKERRHREPAGPVGNQKISCFSLGPCKCPFDYRFWASGLVVLGVCFQALTGWAHTSRAPPLLSTGSRFGRLGLTSSDSDGDLIYPPLFPWLRRYGSAAFFLQRGRSVAGRTGPLPLPMQPSSHCGRTFRSWRVFLCPDSLMLREPELGPVAGFPLRARTRCKFLGGWLVALAKQFTYQVNQRAGPPTRQPTSTDTGLENLPRRSCTERR